MSERTAFILFGLAIPVLTFGWVIGLKLLGADEELIGQASLLLLPGGGARRRLDFHALPLRDRGRAHAHTALLQRARLLSADRRRGPIEDPRAARGGGAEI